MRQPSLILECNSLIPTRTRRTAPKLLLTFCGDERLLSLLLPLSASGETALAPLMTGAMNSGAAGSMGLSSA